MIIRLIFSLQVLWPFLFQTLIPEQYTNGMLAVCKSLTHLARKKRQEEDSDYQIDFVSEGNIRLLSLFHSMHCSLIIVFCYDCYYLLIVVMKCTLIHLHHSFELIVFSFDFSERAEASFHSRQIICE